MYMAFTWSVGQHTDPREYQHALQDLRGIPYAIAHFPPVIPIDVTHVRFYYLPAFLQRGMSLQLRYQTTPKQIEQLDTHFTRMKNVIINLKVSNDDLRFQTSDDPPPPPGYIRTGNFPEDYTIVQLPSVNTGNATEAWGTGLVYGVAISKKRNEIVYWAFGGGG